MINHSQPSSETALIPFVQRFDEFLRIQSHGLSDHRPKKRRKTGTDDSKNARFASGLVQTLQKGFGDRVIAVETMSSENDTTGHDLVFGLKLNPSNSDRVIDRGPAADSTDAKSFREFWGEKSEMRKFADGAICETVVWPAKNVMERRTVLEKIAKYLFERHFKISPLSVHLTHNVIESVLIPASSFSTYGIQSTGEEHFRTLCETYEKLTSVLRSLEGLPLNLSRVQHVSPSLRHTEVFPPVTKFQTTAKACVYVRGDCLVPRPSGLYAPTWKPSHEVQLTLEVSSRWPEDVNAVRKLKCAFYLKLSDLLREQFRLKSRVFEDWLLLKLGAFIFRIVIVYQREVALLKMKKDERGMVVSRNTKESLALEMATVHLPKHAGYILGIVHCHSSFSLTCRLARRWVCSHMLSYFVRHEAVELLVASVFLDCGPHGAPSSASSGFLRFLQLISTHSWLTSPLIVNFNDELTNEQCEEIQSKFVSLRPTLPPMCIVTPDDRTGARWTRPQPTAVIMERFCSLAKASLDVLQSNMYGLSQKIVRTVFQPSLHVYDVLIHLRLKRIPKRFMALTVAEEMSNESDTVVKDKQDGDYFPVVDFDPVENYMRDLKAKYDRFALFFYDSCGGDVIGVLLKPRIVEGGKPTEIKDEYDKESEKEGEVAKKDPDLTTILDGFSQLGKGLVRNVQLVREPSD